MITSPGWLSRRPVISGGVAFKDNPSGAHASTASRWNIRTATPGIPIRAGGSNGRWSSGKITGQSFDYADTIHVIDDTGTLLSMVPMPRLLAAAPHQSAF